MKPLLRKKDFPLNYPKDVVSIIERISFSRGKDITIVGSQAFRSQQYAGDYDLDEFVKGSYKTDRDAVAAYAKRFQEIIRDLLKTNDLYIGDIKAGNVPEWEIINPKAHVKGNKVIGYDAAESRRRLNALQSFIPADDFKTMLGLLKDNPTPKQFFEAQSDIKLHIVRWTPSDVLKGTITLLDGRKMTLEDAFLCHSIVKLDVVAFIEHSRFTDFSIIYIFKNKAHQINVVDEDIQSALKESVLDYSLQGNYFKAAKRMFSLAKQANNTELIEKLHVMLNGDLGRLYSILSDCNTILYLLENETHIPIEKIRYEIDQFRRRLGQIYSIDSVNEDGVLEKILAMEKLPADAEGRRKLEKQMTLLVEFFERVLSKYSEMYMKEHNLMPRKSMLP